MSEVVLRENERLDDLMFRGRKIIQNTEEFCFSLDAVLLAHFPKVHRKDRVRNTTMQAYLSFCMEFQLVFFLLGLSVMFLPPSGKCCVVFIVCCWLQLSDQCPVSWRRGALRKPRANWFSVPPRRP